MYGASHIRVQYLVLPPDKSMIYIHYTLPSVIIVRCTPNLNKVYYKTVYHVMSVYNIS